MTYHRIANERKLKDKDMHIIGIKLFVNFSKKIPLLNLVSNYKLAGFVKMIKYLTLQTIVFAQLMSMAYYTMSL